MRAARRRRIDVQGKAKLGLESGDISGKLVVDLRHVGFQYGDQEIITDLSTRILRGDRVGIIGPNGSGKSTLLKLILGELKPGSGQVVMGTRLQLAYYDQQRAQLDLNKTVRDNVSEGRDYINIKGRPRHVVGYLKEFLFPPERIDSPVKSLSGGERNRLLLAKMFTQASNMMVLDEPTNDLDVDTLELLEDLLANYDGTLLLVSHDRTFLDNVVTSTLVFEGGGRVKEYVGGYDDWLRQRKTVEPVSKKDTEKKTKAARRVKAGNSRKQKLSYLEKRELESLPGQIEKLEQEQQQLSHQVSQGEFYQQDSALISSTLARLEALQRELQDAYDRWETLDDIQA
jgi:ATP-binding cassette subfamily F protein uup